MNNQVSGHARPVDDELVWAGAEDDIQQEGFVQLQSRPRDVSLIRSCIQKLGADLNAAVQAIWSRRHQSRYSGVYVLMISWEDDDLGVWREIAALRNVFEERYNFDVEEYRIPSIDQPDRALKRRVIEFLDSSDEQDKLLIVYYAGHARRAPEENAAPLWCANRSSPQPAISSAGIQSMFEEADADVLLIYDCCHSAAVSTIGSNIPATGYKQKKHTVEIIAACGFESVAAEVDQHSFSKALTEILALKSQGRPFSVGFLHGQILGRLKCWVPSLLVDREGKFIQDNNGILLFERQPRRTPFYSIVCETEPRRNILLASMPHRDCSSSPNSISGQNTPSDSDSDASLSDYPGATADRALKKLKLSSDDDRPLPQILLTIPLKRHEIGIPQWTEWIRNVPAAGRDVHVEGAYEPFSNGCITRVPVAGWNRLSTTAPHGLVSSVALENLSCQVEPPQDIPSCPPEDSSPTSTGVQRIENGGSVCQISKMKSKTDISVVGGDIIQDSRELSDAKGWGANKSSLRMHPEPLRRDSDELSNSPVSSSKALPGSPIKRTESDEVDVSSPLASLPFAPTDLNFGGPSVLNSHGNGITAKLASAAHLIAADLASKSPDYTSGLTTTLPTRTANFVNGSGSHVHSSSNFPLTRRVGRPYRFEQIWFCCQCGLDGPQGLALWNGFCPACSHCRNSCCTIEQVKIYEYERV
ncbi:hypothetical protein EG329_008051 [Mollisiaceae sp. DMI_Dod_QoI]|nr:hypothetical protein EG329_008051 [Helotiales sp. DMI_Dod_QoI]